ncbi:acyltransferase [Curtobacterium citreum]|uniref:Acyltransferase n=1 Tax=Curtobacterium citreum TaxID=2036 RepID=A0ABT2HLF3_9MICO|nr:acyltransferase [Curtobacterium citreum]MCS5486976.1 acyltransferase [Curtobacterium flaccumfaciens pv. basellae]MCS6523957.1 acyltransferase [Curtobacterium citreum]TQJ29066.1 peptidoglycan/LPS O-acetylase OafA/YrhL [Curtobacterium citreum]GGL88084.1 acyltransferase [Curtobacterium citreum]
MTTNTLAPEHSSTTRRATAAGRATGAARTTPPPPLTNRAPALDGLRTIAILAVILYHLHVPQFEGGFIGVTVFFALSGFLITTLLLGEHRKTGRIRLGSFWWKRLLRLYPALLALVAVGLLLWNWVGDYKGASFGPGEAAFIALTYTGNLFRSFWDTTQGVFAHTWSLSMEEQFYLVWPPVLVLLFVVRARRRWLMAGLGAVIVGCSIAAGLVYQTPNGGSTPDVYFSPVLGVVPLATGCLLALLLDDVRVRTWAAGVAGHVASWAGLALLVGILLWIGDDWTQHAWTFGVVLPLTGVVSSVLIAGLVSVRSPLSAALAWTPVSWFGRRVSYSAYLWHPLVIALLDPFAIGPWGTVWLIAVALLVAVGAAYAVEVPVEKARKRVREARSLVAADRAERASVTN